MKSNFIFQTIIFIIVIISFFVENGQDYSSARGIIHLLLAAIYLIFYIYKLKSYIASKRE